MNNLPNDVRLRVLNTIKARFSPYRNLVNSLKRKDG